VYSEENISARNLVIFDVFMVAEFVKLPTVQIVFPAVLYRCESWTLRKADKRKVEAFELWMWRRLLRIPWTAKKMNALVINQIKPRHSLETLAVIGRLKYFGHVMSTSDLMFGLTDSNKRRGRQWTKWTDEMRRTLAMNWHDIINATQNRTQWSDLIYKAVENRNLQKRKLLKDSETLYLLLGNPIASPVVTCNLKEILLCVVLCCVGP
jgi:hypothetical protein